MTYHAHICGPLGQALVTVEGETWLYDKRSRRLSSSNEIRWFFDHGVEIAEFKDGELPPSDEQVWLHIEIERKKYVSLHRQLMGMDSELGDGLRQRAVRAGDTALADPDVLRFTERRFLRPVPTQQWDLDGALQLCRRHELDRAGRLYAIVEGPILLAIESAIGEWADEQETTSLDRANTIKNAYADGLVSELAAALFDRNDARLRAISFLPHSTIVGRRLAMHLAKRLSAPAPRSMAQDHNETDDLPAREADPLRYIQILISSSTRAVKSGVHSRGKRKSVEERLGAVLAQIEWIAERFRSGQRDRAWTDLARFVELELTEGDADRLAVSLTNLATHQGIDERDAWTLSELALIAAPQDPMVSTAQAGLLRKWGRHSDSLAAYDRVIEAFPQHIVARTGRAEALRSLGRLDEALAAYELIIDTFPQNVVARNGYAETLRALGRLEEALAAYDKTIESFQLDVFVLTGRAEALRSLGRLEEALAAYDWAIEVFPQQAVAHNGRAEVLRSLGRLEEALTAYDQIIEMFPQNVVARNARAETLRSLGRLDEALAVYDQIIETFQEDVFAHNGRAEALRSLGRLDEALDAYDQIIQAFPQDVVARNARSETLRSMARLDEALDAYDRTIETFPQNTFARNGRAEVLRSLGRLEEALVAYDKTIESFPQDAFARSGRAEALRSLGRLDEALDAYKLIIDTFPYNVVARNGHAETLRSLGRLDEALAAYDRTINSFQQDAFALTGRAEALRSLGRLGEALAAYNQIIEALPHNIVAHTGRAEALRSLGRLDEALAAYNQIIETFPQDVVVCAGRAEVLRSMGRLTEAADALLKTSEMFPFSTFAVASRAAVLCDLGDLETARALLTSVPEPPRTHEEWVAKHIECAIELRVGVGPKLVQDLERLAAACPYAGDKLYFQALLISARLALGSVGEARRAIGYVSDKFSLEADEKAALLLMDARAAAAEGDTPSAIRSLSEAAVVFPYEQFALRRMRQEIERRFGLAGLPPLRSTVELAASQVNMMRFETAFWAQKATQPRRLVA